MVVAGDAAAVEVDVEADHGHVAEYALEHRLHVRLVASANAQGKEATASTLACVRVANARLAQHLQLGLERLPVLELVAHQRHVHLSHAHKAATRLSSSLGHQVEEGERRVVAEALLVARFAARAHNRATNAAAGDREALVVVPAAGVAGSGVGRRRPTQPSECGEELDKALIDRVVLDLVGVDQDEQELELLVGRHVQVGEQVGARRAKRLWQVGVHIDALLDARPADTGQMGQEQAGQAGHVASQEAAVVAVVEVRVARECVGVARARDAGGADEHLVGCARQPATQVGSGEGELEVGVVVGRGRAGRAGRRRLADLLGLEALAASRSVVEYGRLVLVEERHGGRQFVARPRRRAQRVAKRRRHQVHAHGRRVHEACQVGGERAVVVGQRPAVRPRCRLEQLGVNEAVPLGDRGVQALGGETVPRRAHERRPVQRLDGQVAEYAQHDQVVACALGLGVRFSGRTAVKPDVDVVVVLVDKHHATRTQNFGVKSNRTICAASLFCLSRI